MRRHRNVKIVATLGPASSSYEMIKALHDAGADVFRLNMSHGTHDEIAERHRLIRQIEAELSSPIAILADLQGPKLRVGSFAKGEEELENGASFRMDLDTAEGDKTRVCLPHPEIFAALRPDATLLVNDGKIRLRVKSCGADFAECKVINGGTISNRKGVNVPDVILPVAALSEKDRADLEFACELGIDWLALSFVQRPEDLVEARELAKGRAAILSKIEKPSAVERFDDILNASDGIMVARGDLGVELPVQNVPPIQKRLVRKCRAAAKPVIVATQMLESMIESQSPSRAEVNDVANSIMDGADAVMLSGETSVGEHPVEVIKTISQIIGKVENSDLISLKHKHPTDYESERFITKSVCYYAAKIANDTKAKAISTLTNSGYTAYQISSWRPKTHVLVFTSNRRILTQLNLLWGVKAFYYNGTESTDRTIEEINEIAVKNSLLQKDDKVINLTSMPIEKKGMVNTVRVSKI